MLPALYAYVTAPQYAVEIRRLNRKLMVANAVFTQVPFDLEHWTKVAAEQYPNGLPEPHSDDPTQWLFKGNIVGSEAPLQVAVARLLGYRWPDQESDELDAFTDPDGIVCLPSVGGDAPAAERLQKAPRAAYGADWSARQTASCWRPLVARRETSMSGCAMSSSRSMPACSTTGPSSGRSGTDDGMASAPYSTITVSTAPPWRSSPSPSSATGSSASVRRNAPTSQVPRHAWQPPWASTQPAAHPRGRAPLRHLCPLEELAEQPIGWEPDVDDGVRLNIRPFVKAGMLRDKFTINWNKDRGKNPDGSERLNDLHLTIAEKRERQG